MLSSRTVFRLLAAKTTISVWPAASDSPAETKQEDVHAVNAAIERTVRKRAADFRIILFSFPEQNKNCHS
jgi:hypothetical protein